MLEHEDPLLLNTQVLKHTEVWLEEDDIDSSLPLYLITWSPDPFDLVILVIPNLCSVLIIDILKLSIRGSGEH